MLCRICGSSNVLSVDIYRPYIDYEVVVFDCISCESRFVKHDVNAYEMLHANPSSYNSHAKCADIAEPLFLAANYKHLKRFLSGWPKNKFVIDFIDSHQRIHKIAEIGCSRGYLTSYFIATNRDAYGFDISQTAVDEATRAFGKRFYFADRQSLEKYAPYDAIYFVGTIGCVESPIEMIYESLALLKSGGWLLFNAPNRRYLAQTGDLWLSTPPPDLVTIFAKKFWEVRFNTVATVSVWETYLSLYGALTVKIAKQGALISDQRVVGEDDAESQQNRGVVLQPFRQGVGAALKLVLGRFGSSVVDPYGVFVVLQKK